MIDDLGLDMATDLLKEHGFDQFAEILRKACQPLRSFSSPARHGKSTVFQEYQRRILAGTISDQSAAISLAMNTRDASGVIDNAIDQWADRVRLPGVMVSCGDASERGGIEIVLSRGNRRATRLLDSRGVSRLANGHELIERVLEMLYLGLCRDELGQGQP